MSVAMGYRIGMSKTCHLKPGYETSKRWWMLPASTGFHCLPCRRGACGGGLYVRHPEKVSHLILYGAYARGWLHRDLTERQREEERLLIDLMRVGWGKDNPAFRQVFATQLMPDATTDELQALDEQMRMSASPENAARLESEMHRSDVRHLAPQIQVPTLIVIAVGMSVCLSRKVDYWHL
jgi:hypothetical protein